MAKNRSIFEEVATTEKQVAETGVIDKGRGGARGAIRIWLMMLFALVVVMIAVGGVIVGLGASLGSGCTSGHGVCGLSRLSIRSLVAVPTFMATAAVTVFLIRHVFGG